MLRSITRTPTPTGIASLVQKQAVRTLMTSLPSTDRARSSALGAIRSTGGTGNMLNINNLEDFQFDDSATVRNLSIF
jgi:hypothetical protein